MAIRTRSASGVEGGVVIIGAKEFRRDLRAAVGHVRDMKSVNIKVANLVVGEARQRSIIGPAIKGHIKDTIRPYATTTKAGVSYGSAKNPYPFVREFGFPRRNYSEAPVIYPSIKDKGPEIIERYGEFVERVFARAYPS